jgi:hypothetical protein
MRRVCLAAFACLLSAATATAQPPAAEVPPAEPIPAFDLADNAWKMCGPRAWASAEYLLWWVRPMNTPDLIQTVPSDVALRAVVAGTTLPAGSTSRYFPDESPLKFGAFSGVRGNFGVNFDRFGLDASVIYLPEITKSGGLSTTGSPLSVGQSYIRAGTGTPITLLASLNGISTGGITSDVSSKLWSADGNVRLPFYNLFTDSTDAIVGFRYFDLQEKLNTSFRSDLATGTTVLINDSVDTKNQFYGGQVGLNGRINGVERGLGFDSTGKLALGGMHQSATLNGSNTFLNPGLAPDTEAGGLYARGANLGHFSRDRFAMIYEQTFNVTYNFNSRSQVYFGYSIIWVSSVMRPGNAIDPVVNDSGVRFIANPPAGNTANRPAFSWNAGDFWAQGMNFGFRLQY